MKKNILILALLSLTAYLAIYNYFSRSPEVTTGLSIFVDYVDPSGSNSSAVLEETLKTIDAKCNHIFINKLLWQACLSELDKDLFKEEWDIYNTHVGLLYLKQKSYTQNIGIKTETFSLLSNPFSREQLEAIHDDFWSQKMDHLIDVSRWQKYHNNPKSHIVIYMNGHGTERTDNLDTQLTCGIKASNFAKVFAFLHDKLKITLLGVQSCFWTTERLYELIKSLGYKSPHCTILSPLNSEKGLWLDTINNYLRKKDSCYCFYDCCISFSQIYNYEITPEIKELINNTDTLQLRSNKNQKATILAAGSQQVITI